MSNFCEVLRNLLKREKLSLMKAQQELGISRTQLGRYISGYYMPTLKNALIICDYFKCSLDYLLGKDDIPNWYGDFNEPDFDKFSKRYAELLIKNDTNHYRLTHELKINRNNLVYWNKKRVFPTLDILLKISIYLNSSIEFLIGRTDLTD